ncbi:MAG: YgfZ/GcvT domain-containing protein [Gemmatimonadales bacterium]
MAANALPEVHVIGPDDLSKAEREAVMSGAAVALADAVCLAVTGPGVIECLQGVLTNDVEARGERGFIFGAVLTPKGMIVCDLWLARDDDAVMLFPSPQGSGALLEVFQRSLPPRLAHVEDRSPQLAVLRATGPLAVGQFAAAGIPLPAEGRTARIEVENVPCLAARPPKDQPFALQLSCAAHQLDALAAALSSADFTVAAPAALEAARIFTGWPRLGAEIDQKTLPQEVRLDELDGVSYTKGCYTGQETVARVHFRGHVNRALRGLTWDEAPPLDDPTVWRGATKVGRVTSAVWLDTGIAGLAVLKRDVEPGVTVAAGGREALVEPLPLSLP